MPAILELARSKSTAKKECDHHPAVPKDRDIPEWDLTVRHLKRGPVFAPQASSSTSSSSSTTSSSSAVE